MTLYSSVDLDEKEQVDLICIKNKFLQLLPPQSITTNCEVILPGIPSLSKRLKLKLVKYSSQVWERHPQSVSVGISLLPSHPSS